MLAKIIGTIWVVLGLLWLVKPESLKYRLKKKLSRKLRRVVFAFILVFGLLIIGSVLKAPGILAKIVGIIGIFIAVKAVLLLTSKTQEKLFDWWAERPIIFFRIWAAFVLATGIMLVLI